MKSYARKALSVLLALLMCITVVALDYSSLVAGAYTASPTHSYYFQFVRTSADSDFDGQDGGGTLTIYAKNQNGKGTQTTLKTGSFDARWADGTTISTETFTNTYWPTSITIGCNINNNNSMFYSEKTINVRVDLYVKDDNTGTYNRYEFGNFSLKSSTTSGGGGSTYKSTSLNCADGIYPKATKVATSKGEANATTTTYNVTLNATGGANKTQAMSAYVYDQYNVIWTAAPTSWSQSGTVACTTSLTTTGASETNTLTMTPTNATRAKGTVTVQAKYDNLYHNFAFNITPTYKITYNVSGNGGTSAAPGPDTTANTNTSSANVSYTIPSGTNYTAKKEKGSDSTGTWDFVGWNGSQSATSGTKPGSVISIDNFNDTLYAIFSKTANATFYWYNANGTRTSSTASNTVFNNATQYTFTVPKTSVPTTFIANGTTYTFAGWAVDSTTATEADYASTVTSASRPIKNGNLTDTYNFYALYTASVTLSYNNNGGSGLPASQTKNLILNCGANANAANNASGRATFTLNPDNIQMRREYSSAFVGWKTQAVDANGIDAETAEYKDGTVTWEESKNLPAEITIAKDTTVYAAYYDFRYNVKFYDNTGALLDMQTIRHNFSAVAPSMKTNSSDPSHTDSGSHYVFDHWEYTDGAEYKDTDKLTKLVNGYTYEVWGKYVGHKHIWGDPYDIHGATTCTNGAIYKMMCTACGFVREFEEEPLGHDFELVGVAEATCTRPGSYGKLICKNCGALDPDQTAIIDGVETPVTDDNRIIPPLGHDYGVDIDNFLDENGNYIGDVKSVSATCTTAGYYYYQCSRCSEEYRVGNIPATGHNWDKHDEIPATCTEDGVSAYTVCLNCDLYLIEKVELPAKGHNPVLIDETDSTCVVKGHTEYYQCANCGKYYEDADAEVEIEDITVKDKELSSHDYQPAEEDIEPTCTENGYKGAYVCTVCGEVDPDRQGEVVPAKSHNYQPTRHESDVPCATPGYTEYVCSNCGDSYIENDELAEHTKGDYVAPVPATCLEEGYTEGYTCSVCGGYYQAPEVVKKLSHQMTTVPGYAPTCTEDGKPDRYHCSLCDKDYLDNEGLIPIEGSDSIIPALEHNWTGWVTAVLPTDTEPGLEKRRCIRCGEVEENEIAATGHIMNKVEYKEATCTEDGNIAYYECAGCGKYFRDEEGTQELNYEDIILNAPGHDMDVPSAVVPATCAEDGYEEYVCSRCNNTVVITIPKNNEHPSDKIIPYGLNIIATCAAVGQEAGTMCSLCGEVLTQPKTLPKTAHTPELRDVRAAKCAETGYTGDTYCSVCNQIISKGAKIEVKGHRYNRQTVIDATCTSYGQRIVFCDDCDAYTVYETPILGHQVVTDSAVSATCEHPGLTAGYHCARCDEYVLPQEEIAQLDHNYVISAEVASTCTVLGYRVYTCTAGCGDSYREYDSAKLDHEIGTPATCTSPAVCANCGRTFGGHLDHSYIINNDLGTDSTCSVHGIRVYECELCGDTYTEEKDLIEHSWDEATLEFVPATCTENGLATIYCSECGASTSEIVDATGHSYQGGVCVNCGEPENVISDDTPTSSKCSKCGLNHNGRTGLWKENGLLCKFIAFFRSLFGLNK
ncbi:MAG: hypothetical protein J1E34_01645 [Oscillospiraceae bacterium]|nr:hypothetical protein [Oscillospiraceae bacterium]